jgi:hypothetical protein
MICNTNFSADEVAWDSVADPHGTGAGVVVDTIAPFSHGSYSETNAAGADGNGQHLILKVGTNPGMYLARSPKANPLLDPPFAGIFPASLIQTLESYTGIGPVHPTGSDGNFVVETRPFEGGAYNTYRAVTGQLFEVGIHKGWGDYDAKKLSGVLAIGGGTTFTHPLLEISGPHSKIGGTSADSYKFCYTLFGGECHAGSVSGEFYVNVPNASPGCDRARPNSICVAPLGALAQKVTQIRWDDSRSWRPITTSFRKFGVGASYWNARVLPGGTHLLTFSDGDNDLGTVLLVKLPPSGPPDNIDRSTFVPVPIAVPAGPIGSTNAVIRFGYRENGPVNAFHCTMRAEPCVAVTGNVNITDPFKFETSESYSGIPCSAGCRITIPLLPQRIVYFQPVYRDSANKILAVGPIGAATETAATQVSEIATPQPNRD